jgi:prepilin-type N-terminal cleavage/methylation domain-containing protein
MKNQNGVTLVEIIVVAVIVGILSSIGIPLYAGYIRDQRQTTVDNFAETAGAAANAYVRRTGDSAGVTYGKLSLYIDTSKYPVTITTGSRSLTVKDKKSNITSTTVNY